MAEDEKDDLTPELQDLAWEAEPGLSAAVRRSIHRRLLSARATELTWSAPATVVLEFVRLVFQWLAQRNNQREDEHA